MQTKQYTFAPIFPKMNNFKKIITEFVSDLTRAFPESPYSSKWNQWPMERITEEEIQYLFTYCTKTYPLYFMDILHKKDIFSKSKDVLCFLPEVDFCVLFQDEKITAKSKDAMWNYLQLILFSIISNVTEKDAFRDEIFKEFQSEKLLNQLTETIQKIASNFMQESSESEADPNPSTKDDSSNEEIPCQPSMPSPDEIHSHLKSLFDGKIGNLAKGLVEELLGNLKDILGTDFENVKSTEDVFKNLLRNPMKIQSIIQLVSEKLQSKMDSGEISQDELLKEAESIFSKMQGFEKFTKNGKMGDILKLVTKFSSMFGKQQKSGEEGDEDDMFGAFGNFMKEFTKGQTPQKQQTVFQGQGVRTGNQIISNLMKNKLKNRIMKKKELQEMKLQEEILRRAEAEKNYKPYEEVEATDIPINKIKSKKSKKGRK